MPSVGMRKTTRVFGARVLRSGRRLWTGPGEGKRMRAADGEECIEILDNSGDGGGDVTLCKENGWHDNDASLKQEVSETDAQMEVEEKIAESDSGDNVPTSLVDRSSSDRKWGAIYQRKRKRGAFYQRKRKRVDSGNSNSLENPGKKTVLEDKKFGKQFFRKQWRSRLGENPKTETWDLKGFVGNYVLQGSDRCRVLAAVVESSSSSSCWFTCFLNLVLSYMRRARVRLSHLSTFMFAEPIAHVYSSHGIHFLQDSYTIKNSGVCAIWGARCFVPMFAVDFSAVPCCFKYLHSSLLIKSAYLPYELFIYSEKRGTEVDRMNDEEEQQSCVPSQTDQSGSKCISSLNENSGNMKVSHPHVAVPKLASRTLHLRNGVKARSIKKRRSSLRSRRTRNPSVFGIRKSKGVLATDIFSFRYGAIPVSSASSTRELRSSVRRTSATDMKDLTSTVMGLTQDIVSASCSANLLILEPDKCYREEGAIITLEISALKQWFLAVKIDGIRRYSLNAQKTMRPCSCNRFTRAIIWTEDNGWKLEFPNRQDWWIFKKLYKECSDRNVRAPPLDIIPVPGIRVVSGHADSSNIPFVRPDSYIKVKDDEVARALVNRASNFEVNSDDEEWLNKFNNELSAESALHGKLSAESFESIIDAFEKGFYCNPDDYADGKTAAGLCLIQERREFLEAVHCYWMKKRKQKCTALVRIFQCYQPTRSQPIPKSILPIQKAEKPVLPIPKAILRKKRSFKRQPSQVGRGKQRAMAVEQDSLEEQKNILKVQEAKAVAGRSEGLAVLKRQRAQILMDSADLATYRATMALRIAEAAQVSESSNAGDSSFLP